MLFWKCVSSSRRRRSSSSWPCSVILNWKKKENKVTNIQTCLKWQEWQQLIQAHNSVVHLNHSQHWNSRCYCAVGWNDMSMAAHEATTHLCLCVCSFWRLWGFLLTQVSESLTKENQLFQPFEFTRPECAENKHTSSNQSRNNWAILLRLWVRPCYCEQVGDLFVHGGKGGAKTKQETRAFANSTNNLLYLCKWN